MAVNIQITVTDVNGAMLHLARIKALFTAASTAPELTLVDVKPGVSFAAQLVLPQLELRVSVTNFEDERFLFAEIGNLWQTTNPASTIVKQGNNLAISVMVGAVRLAPTVTVPPDSKIVDDNPRAVLVDQVGGGEWIYRGAYHVPEIIRRLDEPIFGDLTDFEWKRFSNSRRDADLSKLGRFVLLEFGPRPVPGGQIPRFLIGTWAPYKTLSKSPEVVVFYSPQTFAVRGYPQDAYPFLGKYPYAIQPFDREKPAKEGHQPYVDIVNNYVLTGYKIIYQLIAAGRNPIVIMPSSPSANWGPLNTQSGLCRLIREVLRFFYAKQLVSSIAGPMCRLSLASGRASVVPFEGPYTTERLPTAFTGTVSAFSGGIDALVNVCLSANFDEKLYPPEVFSAPPEGLMDNWRETWDIDGVHTHESHKNWDRMVKTLRGWVTGRRTLRAYHSSHTYGASQNGLVAASRVVRMPAKPLKGVYAEEGHSDDERVTWVHFSNESLEGDVKNPGHLKVIPEFRTHDISNPVGEIAHHMVPAIAFGHAAQFKLP